MRRTLLSLTLALTTIVGINVATVTAAEAAPRAAVVASTSGPNLSNWGWTAPGATDLATNSVSAPSSLPNNQWGWQ